MKIWEERWGKKQTNIRNIARDIIPFQQCNITYSKGGFHPKVQSYGKTICTNNDITLIMSSLVVCCCY
jgi:hypothetical protein